MTMTAERPARTVSATVSAKPRPAPSGADVLNEARSFLTRFVAFPSPAAADLAALWAMHTHCADQRDGKLLFDTSPRLAFLSVAKGSGKSRALELTAALSRKPAMISDCTGPAMHTLISNGHCLMLDGLDLILGAGDSAKPVRACINAGYRRSGMVARNKGMASVFAPVAVAGLAVTFTRNPLLEPTRSRAIAVTMKPNGGRVQLDSWRERLHRSEADQLAAAMASWAKSQTVRLTTTFPDMPEGCDDRSLDLFEPLAIVAAVAGGSWPARFEAIYAEFGSSTGSSESAVPPGMQLISDILSVWPDGASRMPTGDIVDALMSAEGSIWPSVWRDAAQITKELSSLLRPYGIAPTKFRPEPGSAPVQGYLRGGFDVPCDLEPEGVPGVQGVPADQRSDDIEADFAV